ncbi:MAG: hypothetical protein ABIC95_03000 [archaeon]
MTKKKAKIAKNNHIQKEEKEEKEDAREPFTMGSLKADAVYFLIALAAFYLVLQIAFFKENPLGVIRTVFGLAWVFLLPGFMVMYLWVDRFSFLERFIIGFGVSGAIIGIVSYYLGLMQVHIKYHTIILPILLIALGAFFIYKKIERK